MRKLVFPDTTDRIVWEVDGTISPSAVDDILWNFAVRIVGEYARTFLDLSLSEEVLLEQVMRLAQQIESELGSSCKRGTDS